LAHGFRKRPPPPLKAAAFDFSKPTHSVGKRNTPENQKSFKNQPSSDEKTFPLLRKAETSGHVSGQQIRNIPGMKREHDILASDEMAVSYQLYL
jgi:hypothetical protein